MPKPKGEQGKVKFRFVEFELEGSDATLVESIRNIAAAIARGPGATTARILTTHRPQALNGTDSAPEPRVEEMLEASEDEATSPRSATRTKAARKPAKPKVIDLDLLTGEVPLKAMCGQMSSDTDTKRYLAIAYWLKEYRSIAEISIDHIYTCYRHMGWNTPASTRQPLIDMRSKRGWFDKGAGAGLYALNHVGENEIRGKLPQS